MAKGADGGSQDPGRAGLSVLTWNVAGRVRTVPDQGRALAERPVDVVALQEVRATAADAWQTTLRALGYGWIEVALPAGLPAADPARRLGVLVASRHPLDRIASPELPWPERHLATVAHAPAGPIEVHSIHVPTSARAEAVKVRTLEALRATVAKPCGRPVVLAGDLNTPQYESREGEVRSFARTRKGNLRVGYDERHDDAELSLVPRLAEAGFVDAFRAFNGYEARDRSWLYPNGKMGYRLDHIFARGLAPSCSAYIHRWRTAGLSDHSALWARLDHRQG